MIVTKSAPFTKEEIEQVKGEFEVYIKTVIDIERNICSAGASRHFESEQILLEQGSKQLNVWGGGIDVETQTIDFNSFINIRPAQNNKSNEIQDVSIRKQYEELTKFFFKEIL
ncbi:MAG: hypothetical protein HYZ63_00310 [Candidatus Andersenbacteria bacterium]|nr:hypothetical protein [Candidatus Andersenbacteria bacterium]